MATKHYQAIFLRFQFIILRAVNSNLNFIYIVELTIYLEGALGHRKDNAPEKFCSFSMHILTLFIFRFNNFLSFCHAACIERIYAEIIVSMAI